MNRIAVRCVIIGIGNTLRGDDGVGIHVARQLAARLPPGVSVLESNGDAAELLEAWTDAPCIFVIDAIQSGATPGTVHRIDANAGPIPVESFRGSSHFLGVGEAVELGRALSQLPSQLIVYGIEGASFESGRGLSAGAKDSAAKVVEEILGEIHRLEMHLLSEGAGSSTPTNSVG